MRGGQLDRRITIQRHTITQSPSGEPIETWVTLSTRPARMMPLQGDERFVSDQLVARAQVEFTVRWSAAIADVTPLDRIVYPTQGNSPDTIIGAKVYDIILVEEVGRRSGLRLLAAVRQDDLH